MKQGWEIKKLGEVCEILDHLRVPITKKDRREGVYPYYGASGIQDYVDSYIFDGRYLLVGEDGAKWGANDKSAYIIEGKSWVNNHAHILKLNDIISDRLVEYYLVSKDLQEYITGAVVPKLTQQALRNIPIPVPPREEQERIVEELDCLSGVIEKKREQLKQLDALAQSIFYQMFGDPITNEKGWKVKKLGEVCNKITDGTHNSPKSFPSGVYMYVTAKNIKKDGFDLSNITYVSEDVHKSIYSRCNPVFGDILYIKDGATTGIAMINSLKEEFSLLSSVALLKCNYDMVSNIFIKEVLNSTSKYNEIRGNMGGAAITRLTINKIENIYIPLPPLALQQEFADKIEAIEKQKELIKKSISETETLFNARMDYYFN